MAEQKKHGEREKDTGFVCTLMRMYENKDIYEKWMEQCIEWRQHYKFYVDFARTCCDLLSRHFFHFIIFFRVDCCCLMPIHHECKWVCIIHAQQPSNTRHSQFIQTFLLSSSVDSPFEPFPLSIESHIISTVLFLSSIMSLATSMTFANTCNH